MNKQQTALKVRETMRKYKEQGSDSPCRKNHIVLFSNNTSRHESMKCAICYNLLKGKIPIENNRTEIVLSEESEYKSLSFITEAVDRRTGKRRDIVILELDQIIEVVNTHMDSNLRKEYEADDVLIIKV